MNSTTNVVDRIETILKQKGYEADRRLGVAIAQIETESCAMSMDFLVVSQ